MIGSSLAGGFRAATLFAPILALGLVGCGQGTATVTGKVIYRNKPLTSGKVSFFDANNNVETAPIQPDGTYTIAKIRPGPAKVTVETVDLGAFPESGRGMMDPAKMGNRQAEKPGKLKPKDPKSKPVLVPKHYADPDKSGLTFDVQSGDNHWDIPLK